VRPLRLLTGFLLSTFLALFVACGGSPNDGAGAITPMGGATVGGSAVVSGNAGSTAGSTAMGGSGTGGSGSIGGSAAGQASVAGQSPGGATAVGGAAGASGSSATGPSYYDFRASDAQGYSGAVDFSPGHYKGACKAGEVATGLSFETTCTGPRVLQCAPGRAWSEHSASVSAFCGDARRDETTTDWDNGFRKAECGAKEAVVGVARGADGALFDLACADIGVTSAGACTVRNVNAGDNRASSSSGDWDSGSWKTECAAGEYVKGVSLSSSTRLPHAILCCSGNGAVGVTPALKADAADQSACRPKGADTTLTPFDKAHLTGSSRNVYQSVTFPEKGSYERITMTLTLSCPANGCDPWDRWGSIGIVLNKNANDPGADQMLELGRFVTPYGVGGTFTYDLTALRPALLGKKELRIFTDTWVDGWLATVKIEMKGGVPAKQPLFVSPLWAEPHVNVGVPSRPVSASAPARDLKLAQAACGLSVRAIITGHGQGNSSNCAEFCPKKHFFNVGSASHAQTVWRDDCATTAVQGQHGTFTYSRAGWCPGADVRAFSVDVGADVNAAVKAGKERFKVGYDVEGYDNSCRPDHCEQSSCVFDTSCDYDGGAHTEPYYALTAQLIGFE
jgi:hypothetical protein